jgi:hypothetical protein
MRQTPQGNIQKQNKTKTLKAKAWTIYELSLKPIVTSGAQ